MSSSKPTLYLETSIPSYQVARPSRDIITLAHQELTHEWWKDSLPAFEVYISVVVLEEAARGDPDQARQRLEALADFTVLEMTEEVERATAVYVDKLPLPERAFRDGAHLAFACVCDIDYLVTWNCAHMANAMMRRRLEKINSQENLATSVICTPEELSTIVGD